VRDEALDFIAQQIRIEASARDSDPSRMSSSARGRPAWSAAGAAGRRTGWRCRHRISWLRSAAMPGDQFRIVDPAHRDNQPSTAPMMPMVAQSRRPIPAPARRVPCARLDLDLGFKNGRMVFGSTPSTARLTLCGVAVPRCGGFVSSETSPDLRDAGEAMISSTAAHTRRTARRTRNAGRAAPRSLRRRVRHQGRADAAAENDERGGCAEDGVRLPPSSRNRPAFRTRPAAVRQRGEIGPAPITVLLMGPPSRLQAVCPILPGESSTCSRGADSGGSRD